MDSRTLYITNRRNKDPRYKKMLADMQVKEIDAKRISGLYEGEDLTNMRRYALILRAEGFIYGR